MGGPGCVIIINCGAAVRGAAAGFAAYYATADVPPWPYVRAAATRLNVTNEELCRFAQTILTTLVPIKISDEYAKEIDKLGDKALELAADMNAAVRTAISAKEAVKIADRAMDLADAQCELFGAMVSEYGEEARS